MELASLQGMDNLDSESKETLYRLILKSMNEKINRLERGCTQGGQEV